MSDQSPVDFTIWGGVWGAWDETPMNDHGEPGCTVPGKRNLGQGFYLDGCFSQKLSHYCEKDNMTNEQLTSAGEPTSFLYTEEVCGGLEQPTNTFLEVRDKWSASDKSMYHSIQC